jgi:co-chaperonin GroES (HSP10)|tara:strand:+ start:476 stop:757 length:282 start_codon:yes stop_codon:yes gene_type:complete
MLEPRNRHIVVIPKEEQNQEEERAVLLPENYRKPQSEHTVVSVVSAAPDVSQLVMAGDTVVVDRSMLKEISLDGSTYHLILENYILGIVQAEV